MELYKEMLTELFNRVPRRHSDENVKEINGIVNDYENILGKIEGINPYYEKNTAVFYTGLEAIRSAVKMSTDRKASKKNKDNYFDEASGLLKDDMQALMNVYANGSKTG